VSAESYVASRRLRKQRAGQYGHGWLAAVIPAEARSYRVGDAALADALRHVDAELVRGAAEVEIAPSRDEALGDAPLAIITIDPPPRTRRPRLVRALRRLGTTIRTRLRARVARRELHRLGYPNTRTLLWDVGQKARLPTIPAADRSLAERLPERALALGWRGPKQPTALEAALQAAGEAVGKKLEPRWASIRAGTLIVATDGGMLRMAVGHSRSQIENHIETLGALSMIDLPSTVTARVPWLLAHGRVGLADWSLERMLPGSRPPRALDPALLEESLEFLVALHSTTDGARAVRPQELAETVASVCGDDSVEILRAVASRLDRELADLPRGWGHGDFFAGNLLAAEGRLSGVIDWDAAGPGRLPLLDLFHLQVTRVDYGGDHQWGAALLDRLLPLARSGGDDLLRRYCAKRGLEADAGLLETLVVAYWLEYVSYQLRTHLDRLTQPEWLEGNVEGVLRDLEPFAAGGLVAREPQWAGRGRAAR
jgi:Phosphotransferase enzyme family